MTTEIILLERVENLGQMGEKVRVRPGFARNYLLPQGKALRATKANEAYFEAQRKALEAHNEKRKQEAEATAGKLRGLTILLIRQAAESGQLYGSVSTRDIADAIREETGIRLERSQIEINHQFKTIGLFDVTVSLHPEVKVDIRLNVARSEDEAKVQEKTGRAVIAEEDQTAAEAAEEALKEAVQEAEEKAEEQKEEFLEESALETEAEAAEASAASEDEESSAKSDEATGQAQEEEENKSA